MEQFLNLKSELKRLQPFFDQICTSHPLAINIEDVNRIKLSCTQSIIERYVLKIWHIYTHTFSVQFLKIWKHLESFYQSFYTKIESIGNV